MVRESCQKATLAVPALADTVIIAAVISSLVADHIEEDAVERIVVHRLAEYLEHVFLLITAADAGMHLPVIVHVLAGFADVEPLGIP